MEDVLVATDDERIRELVLHFSGKVIMTGFHHQSGTDCVAEAVAAMDVGLYAYRKYFLLRFSKRSPGYLEQREMLEQLRVLERGYKILVTETTSKIASGLSTDTPEDLAKVETLFRNGKIA